MAKILIVEDDIAVSANLKAWLEKENHIVDMIADGREGLELLQIYSYDLAIVDWQLPGMDGAQICLELRRKGSQMPILMLTSRSSIDDKVEGLEAGAYDYLVKPCALIELSARVRALLRRHGGNENEKSCFIGDLEIKFDSHEVLKGSKKIPLSPIEFEIFKLLARHPDSSFSADAILSRLWSDKPQVSKQLVKVHVKNLRKKLDAAQTLVAINTEKGEGYSIAVNESPAAQDEMQR